MWSDLTLLLARCGLGHTQAAGGDRGFPINVLMAFPHGTWGQILVIVLLSVPRITFCFMQISLP